MPSIHLPQAVKDMSAATVTRWLKQPGEALRKGEVVVELEIERALIQLEAVADGTLDRVVVPVGGTAAVGAELARLAQGSSPVGSTASFSASSPVAAPGSPTAGASSCPGGPVVPILMPQAGNSMEEGTIVAWKVKEGDRIAVGQVIFDLETDKATMEYESPSAGRLARIVLPDGGTAAVQKPVAYLADSTADVDAFLAAAGHAAPAQAASPAADTSVAAAAPATPSLAAPIPGGRVKASPAARHLAAEKHLDLAGLAGAGSGPGGRILSTDLARAPGIPGTPAASGTPSTPATTRDPAGAVRRPMSKMRRAIAAALQASKQTAPHFYVRVTLDVGPLLAFHRANKPATGCTVTDLIILACGRLIGANPAIRTRIDGSDLVEMPHADIGIAVGVDDGLVVPVVLGVENLTLKQLAGETRRVVEAARRGRLENLGRGVFTVSNLGMFGVEEFSAIINPPESAILAVGAAREAMLVQDGVARPGRVLTVTLSADHRVLDGVAAAQFAAKLRETLEHPETLA
jgi:pyruvate dehydrogenase E2 component (dihydrolipoamide acetyltransferase)